jgi:glyoxylase-like metal-dependent hydrolase (beta-lactamase superfamily II)
MGIKTPLISEIAKNTYAINEFGLSTMYLLVGEDKALLVDTGCGICNLKEEVAKITEKPYDVVLTHGHIDHAGGVGAFDRIHLCKADYDMVINLDFAYLKEYADMLGKSGGYNVYDYSPEVIKPFAKAPELIPIYEGKIFELGNRPVEAFEIPGHTPGGICFMDDKTGILFSGDACNTNLLADGASITTTLGAFDKLKKIRDRFTRNFSGHTGYAGMPECRSVPDSVLEDCIYILESVLKHTDTPEKVEFLGNERIGMRYGCSRIIYNPDRLIDAGENPVR